MPTVLRAIVIGAAVLAATLPLAPEWVEATYTHGVYRSVQRVLTSGSNLVPFAVLDPLTALALAWMAWPVRSAVREARSRRSLAPLGPVAARWCTAAAVGYLVFLAAWGLNYRRPPLASRLVGEPGAPSAAAVGELGFQAVRQLNRLRGPTMSARPADPWGDPRLLDAFARTQRQLGGAGDVVPGRPKRSLAGVYFRWAGVDGMVNPFALEVLVNPDLTRPERAFVAAHEWGHLAGYANEAEASFVGWLTCLGGGPEAQYSGWLFLYWQVAAEVDAPTRVRLWEALDSGPRQDVAAIVARLRRGELPAVRMVSWRVYDQYLKANRVDSGVRSYSEVVTLILRTHVTGGWTPTLRAR